MTNVHTNIVGSEKCQRSGLVTNNTLRTRL